MSAGHKCRSGMARRVRPEIHEHQPIFQGHKPVFLDSGLAGRAHAPE
jgi:hypothetical protein